MLSVIDRAVRFLLWTKIDLEERLSDNNGTMEGSWLFSFLTACTFLISSDTGATWGFEKLQVSVTNVIYLASTIIAYKLLKYAYKPLNT